MKRIISTIVLVCFLLNTAVSDYAFALAPNLVLDDMMDGAPHAKNITLCEMRLAMDLAELDGLHDIDNATDIAVIKEAFRKSSRLNSPRSYRGAPQMDSPRITAYFDEVAHIGAYFFLVPISIELPSGKRLDYRLIFSTVRSDGVFSSRICQKQDVDAALQIIADTNSPSPSSHIRGAMAENEATYDSPLEELMSFEWVGILQKAFDEALTGISRRDRQVLELRAEGLSFEQIARRPDFNITRERVRQLQMRGERRLWNILAVKLNRLGYKDFVDQILQKVIYNYKVCQAATHYFISKTEPTVSFKEVRPSDKIAGAMASLAPGPESISARDGLHDGHESKPEDAPVEIKGPRDLFRFIALYYKSDSIFSTTELYDMHRKINPDASFVKRSSGIINFRRYLYESENSLSKSGLIERVPLRGERGDMRFKISLEGRKWAQKIAPDVEWVRSARSPEDAETNAGYLKPTVIIDVKSKDGFTARVYSDGQLAINRPNFITIARRSGCIDMRFSESGSEAIWTDAQGVTHKFELRDAVTEKGSFVYRGFKVKFEIVSEDYENPFLYDAAWFQKRFTEYMDARYKGDWKEVADLYRAEVSNAGHYSTFSALTDTEPCYILLRAGRSHMPIVFGLGLTDRKDLSNISIIRGHVEALPTGSLVSVEQASLLDQALALLPHEWMENGLDFTDFAWSLVGLTGKSLRLDKSSVMIFSEKVTFDNGLGALLPELARSARRIVVITRDAKRIALIDQLNEGKSGNERIVVAESVADARSRAPASNYTYFKMKGDPEAGDLVSVTTIDITELVNRIIEILGRVKGIAENTQAAFDLYQATRKFIEAAA